MSDPLAILGTGMVTGVGLSAPASCAAIRAGIDNFRETRFMDSDGEWIMGSPVPLDEPRLGTAKLAKMLAMAIEECLASNPALSLSQIPVIVGLAETQRPGRPENLESDISARLRTELGTALHPRSSRQSCGRVAGIAGLMQARKLIYEENFNFVIVAGVDSLLVAQSILAYDRCNRLLTSSNSNGFLPGEGAAAVLVTKASDNAAGQVVCAGLGAGIEEATVESEEPLRGDGMVEAIEQALTDAKCRLSAVDYRIADISGEQYSFKEATIALARVRDEQQKNFDIWHPSECIGEIGAATALVSLGVFATASWKGYSLGSGAIYHGGNDDGRRVAAVLRYGPVSRHGK